MARLKLMWAGAALVALVFAFSLAGCGTSQPNSTSGSAASGETPAQLGSAESSGGSGGASGASARSDEASASSSAGAQQASSADPSAASSASSAEQSAASSGTSAQKSSKGGSSAADGSPSRQKEEVPIDETSTDQMWSTEARDVTMDLYCFGGKLYTVDGSISLRFYLDREPEDGQFYRIVADVTYLNGGIAGYYNYPQIDDVTSFERISVSDLNIPSITEKSYGLTRIGDYADGDLFLNAFEMRAVWKNGEWIYRYDKGSVAEDGRFICRRNGVADEEIEAGVAKGVLSCADYFVAPAID